MNYVPLQTRQEHNRQEAYARKPNVHEVNTYGVCRDGVPLFVKRAHEQVDPRRYQELPPGVDHHFYVGV